MRHRGSLWLAVLTITAAGIGLVPILHAQEGLARARVAYLTGEYDDAIAEFTALARRGQGPAEASRGLMRTLMEIGRYDDARATAERFNDRNGDSPELWNTLGEVLVLQGEHDAAARAFRRAMDGHASDSLTARLNLAILRYRRGDVDVAMRAFDTFIDAYNRDQRRPSDELMAVATAVRYLGVSSPALFRDALRAYDEAIAANPDNIEAQLLVGDLFLEKYEGTEARASFETILDRNPNHPRALLGLARVRRFAGSGEAVELVDRSLAYNPNLVPARTFRALLAIEAEDFDGAAEELERALAVNPSDLDALAAAAALRFVSGDHRAFAEIESRVLALNPRFAGLYTTLAEVSARNRLYREAAGFGASAVRIDSTSWSGYAQLGINQLRVGAMPEGRRNLEIAFRGDPYDAWTKNTLDLLDTLETYHESTTDRFRIAVDRSEADVLALYVGDLAEEAFDAMAARYGYRPDTPIRLELYPDHADFSVRTVGLTGLGALGVSFGPVIAMDSPSARDVGDFSWGSTLWHELAHSFHMGQSAHRVPRWFTEGLAVWEERRARSGWGDGPSPSFLMAYRDGRLHPVSRLNDGFMRPAYPEQLVFSYYQASLVCDLIERDHGAAAFARMLQAFGRGLTTDRVFRDVLGVDLGDFDGAFDAYMHQRFAGPLAALGDTEPLDIGPQHAVSAFLQRARQEPDDYLAQLWAAQALAQQRRLDEAEPFLRRAKALFPEYAGEGSPYWLLGIMHRERGELREAVRELAALTERNAGDYRALLELAVLHDSLGNSREAADALGRALYVYPLDMSVHRRLAELSAELSDWNRAIRERRAVVALQPVDRAEALYQLARTYFAAGQFENARRAVLHALEIAPGFEAAQELLLEIHDARTDL